MSQGKNNDWNWMLRVVFSNLKPQTGRMGYGISDIKGLSSVTHILCQDLTLYENDNSNLLIDSLALICGNEKYI